MRPVDLPSIERLAVGKPHGSRVRYLAGCRCVPCRAANSNYSTHRAAEQRKGNWNGIVLAARARRHLEYLSRNGVGRRAVADASDVCVTTDGEIKRGAKQQIRKDTERRILSVSKRAVSGGALIPARRTWVLIERLLREGFTEKEIAKRLGSRAKKPILQIRRERVTASTQARVERLYQQIMR